MVVRLLQNFSSVTLAMDAQPPKSVPPASWVDVPGRQSIEKVRPGTHLTMFIDVSTALPTILCLRLYPGPCRCSSYFLLGWSLGEARRERGGDSSMNNERRMMSINKC